MARELTNGERIGFKIAAAYGAASAPYILFISTFGPHGPLASFPEALVEGLTLPLWTVAHAAKGNPDELFLLWFWIPLFAIGLALVWWTEWLRKGKLPTPR